MEAALPPVNVLPHFAAASLWDKPSLESTANDTSLKFLDAQICSTKSNERRGKAMTSMERNEYDLLDMVTKAQSIVELVCLLEGKRCSGSTERDIWKRDGTTE